MSDDYIDITAPVAEICHRLGLAENYVARLDIEPGEAKVELFKGQDGRCKGAKYILQNGEPAMEHLVFKVLS